MFKQLVLSSILALSTFVLVDQQSAVGGMVLVQGSQPTGTSSLFNAIGTLNVGNQKARLEAAGQATVQGGNPGNGWFTNVLRSWEVSWNNTTGTVNFKVYATSDWTGTAAMDMTRTPVFTSGNTLLGLDIGGRLTGTDKSLTLGNVQFNDGSGFVDVDSAEATYSGNQFFNNYHGIVGTLADFTLRGTTIFPTGTTTGDSMRFFIDGRQGAAPLVPEPTTFALWSIGLVGMGFGTSRRRRK